MKILQCLTCSYTYFLLAEDQFSNLIGMSSFVITAMVTNGPSETQENS